MCGLVGILDRDGAAHRFTDCVAAASAMLLHRGPDDMGAVVEGPIAFGFRRLKILDLTPAGHQPMSSADGRWMVVFNGEIFNFLELRCRLEDAGVRFRSNSDTEVLVEALAAWGVRTFDELNGMWALLAWDRRERMLLAARDPWGIKPLYVCDQGLWIGFASEIKALHALGCRLGGPNLEKVVRFVETAELDLGTDTLFAGVQRLEPGVVYRYDTGGLVDRVRHDDGTGRVDVPRIEVSAASEERFVDAFRTVLVDAVRIRLRSDVDVGSSLSGGLDSTTIFGTATQILDGERVTTCRHAFTALFEEYAEGQYVEAVVEQAHAQWHRTSVHDDEIEPLASRFFAIHDEPVHSLGPLAGFAVMQLAAKAGVRVLLNGQGGDELLAGYSSSRVPFLRSVLRERGPSYAWAQALAEVGGAAEAVALAWRVLAGMAIASNGMSRLTDRRRRGRRLLHAGMPASGPQVTAGATLRENLDFNRSTFPLPLYLRIEDQNSSAFSLEARLPLLDPRVVAFSRAAPAWMLRHDGANKMLLRRAGKGLIPDLVRERRDKMGFPVPDTRWLRGPLRGFFMDTMSEQRLAARGWYDVPALKSALDRLFAEDRDRHAEIPTQLKRVFLLERWARDRLDMIG